MEAFLENNINEIEILEYGIGNERYGIDVSDIKEILPYKEPTPVPNVSSCVEGIYMPRNVIITIINLASALEIQSKNNVKNSMYIVTNLNDANIAFHVDDVFGIRRVSKENILKPDDSINKNNNCAATGVIKSNEGLIIILDYKGLVGSAI